MTVSVGTVWAMDKGNKRKGKYTYRKVYAACFKRGEIDSKVPFISPADKTQAEWDTVFESKSFDQFKCSQEWDNLSETAISDIFAYMHSGASDSPTPAKCK